MRFCDGRLTQRHCSNIADSRQREEDQMTTYRVVIELKCVYTDGSEETISSALVTEEEREDRAQEKMQELLTHAEVY